MDSEPKEMEVRIDVKYDGSVVLEQFRGGEWRYVGEVKSSDYDG